jgi:hypothetical protein
MRILKLASRSKAMRRNHSILDKPLLKLSENPVDHWTIGDSFEHTFIFGGTGSGKTSGSARALAIAFLRAGFGGLVLCAKPDEASRWEGYARDCGRGASVIRLDASGKFRFNFLDYLMRLPSEQGGGLVDNVVDALMHILESAHGSSDGMGEQSDFWKKSVRELLSNAIAALYHAHGRVTLDELVQLVNSVPISEQQANDPDFKTWSPCFSTMKKLFDDPAIPLPQREATQLVTYFGQTFGQRLDAKTRSNILITLSAEISPFLKGPLHTLFCTDTTVIPEVTHEGVILILDLPTKRFERTGVVAQKLVKYLWQKATERRAVHEKTRPVFLFADEAQFFISSYDREFMSTARSARAAAVYATQNLPSLYSAIGGRNAQDQIDALVGLTQTRIFHASIDSRTNQWAAETIGKAMQRRRSRNWSHSDSSQTSHNTGQSWGTQTGTSRGRNYGSSVNFNFGNGTTSGSYGTSAGQQNGSSESSSEGGNWSSGTSNGHSDSDGGGWSENMDYVIQPGDFANRLRQGGERNGYLVTGILLQANRVFSRTGACWTPVAFKQR